MYREKGLDSFSTNLVLGKIVVRERNDDLSLLLANYEFPSLILYICTLSELNRAGQKKTRIYFLKQLTTNDHEFQNTINSSHFPGFDAWKIQSY